MNNHVANGVQYRRVTLKGRSMVMLDEAEYDRLVDKADEWEPELPKPLPNGNYPAIEYSRISLALKILRDRRRLGLTQEELANMAGIRTGNLNRIERGLISPSVRTVEKIDNALKKAGRKLAKTS